ncbi:protein translocase subunit SecF [Candidatus Kaiserbacteria bacterium]|nr:protein translocase subunit SecF [Candidatus Kaiserbacteria bacterium]
MNIATHRTIYFWLTGLILAVAVAAILFFGLPRAIDFTGGSLMQIRYSEGRPPLATIIEQVSSASIGGASVREVGADTVSIRSRTLTPAEHDAVLTALSGSQTSAGKSDFQELSYTSVGPALGTQFANKALWALLAVVLATTLYIAFAFRKVSRPVPSWCYGLTVVAILVHDLIIPAGFFAVLAYFTGAEVDALFVTALLALLGYSVNDTIVIFDRVREHLARNERVGSKEAFAETVGKSISETMTRSINTSLTTALALLALVIFGAAATRNFALVMLVGVIAGTYSSILLAAPLLIPLSRWFAR